MFWRAIGLKNLTESYNPDRTMRTIRARLLKDFEKRKQYFYPGNRDIRKTCGP